MPRDAVSRTANVGTVGKNGLKEQDWPNCLPSSNRWLCVAELPSEMFLRNVISCRNLVWKLFYIVAHNDQKSFTPEVDTS